MNITRAAYLEPPRRGIRIEVASQSAIIKPIRKSLLERGIAVLVDTKDAVFPWTINLAYHLDGDPTNLDPDNEIVGGTTDPVIVYLARRYWQAIHVGKHLHGRIKIPTREEALEELENSSFWPKPETFHAALAG